MCRLSEILRPGERGPGQPAQFALPASLTPARKSPTTTSLQIRGIPVTLRDRLRRRASRKGVSMSQYVVQRLEQDLALPPMDDWLDAVAALPKADLTHVDTVKLVRDSDAARTEEVTGRSSFSTRRSRSTS